MTNVIRENPIEHPDAYFRAVKANILANARKTWVANTPRADEIEGALDAGRIYNERGNLVGYHEGFIGSLAAAMDKYGKLTPNQSAAILRGIDARAARKAEWASRDAARTASLKHIGTVGKREVFQLTLKKALAFETDYGTMHLHILEDADRNVAIYKGTAGGFCTLGEGETVTVKATVKDHGVRNGVKQTVLSRPVIESVLSHEVAVSA